MQRFVTRPLVRSALIVFGLGFVLSLTAATASAAEPPTSCAATLTADLDLSITVVNADAAQLAFDAVGAEYQFLGRFPASIDGAPQTIVLGPDNPSGFISDSVEVEIRVRSIDVDGSKSDRISCGSVQRLPDVNNTPGSPAFCFLRPDDDPSRQGFLINDESSNRASYNRVVFEQLIDGEWTIVRTEFLGGIGERFFLGGLESFEGLFSLEDESLPTRVRGQFKRLADGSTINSSTTTNCGPMPSAPTITAPSCRTKPAFYLGVDGARRILGVKANNGTVITNEFIWDEAPRLALRYLDPAGNVVRESVTTKWKDVPVGTYTVQIRTETFDYPLLRFSLLASDWITCGTETVP